MNYLKRLAVAASVAAVFAVVGAGSASATVICKTSTSPCASPYLKGTLFKGTLTPGTTAVFKAGFATIECTEGQGSIETTTKRQRDGNSQRHHKNAQLRRLQRDAERPQNRLR